MGTVLLSTVISCGWATIGTKNESTRFAYHVGFSQSAQVLAMPPAKLPNGGDLNSSKRASTRRVFITDPTAGPLPAVHVMGLK